MTSIAIIDYGAGNLDSVRKALVRVGSETTIARTPEDVLAADRLVLPGVGAAGEAIRQLRRSGLDEALTEVVRVKGRPFMGICLGMQLLAERLHEFGDHPGLGWIAGEAVPLVGLTAAPVRVPHMGWNRVEVADKAEDLFWEVRGRREFYFAHSFCLRLTGGGDALAATTEYGGVPLVAAVLDGTVIATQFHPEKSQVNGEHLLGAFVDWKP
jgi:glutamine amidotransferase